MLLIYIPSISPRAKYIFEIIFQEHLGIPYSITCDKNEFEKYPKEKINYSCSRINNSFFIKCSNLLFENNITIQKIPVGEVESHKVLFPQSDCDLGFDIFSASFYMLSRYEEYLPFTPDAFGRFKAIDSLAYQHNFLEIPIIDIWIMLLREKLVEHFPTIQFNPTKHFKALLTYDIDIAYQFKGRNLYRTIGATFKDVLQFNFKNILLRIPVLLKTKKDNWDVYDELQSTIQKTHFSSLFFFLVGKPSKFDRNLNAESSLMKQLIKRIAAFSEIGIHPSFQSNQYEEQLRFEKEKLEQISQQKISKSRQHFLKLQFPKTYSNLIDLGIKEDYTMGFPEMPGFRAGTCHPFYFYNLEKEEKTQLRIFPASCMDATFKYYTKISPEKALAEIKKIIDCIQNVNGHFISIWHNDNLEKTSNKDWRWCYQEMMQYLQTNKANS